MKKTIRFLNKSIVFITFLLNRPSYFLPDKIYIKRTYYRKTKQRINLKNPSLYNEKMQWIKLYDRQPFYSDLVDKYKVRNYVAQIIGEEYLIQNYGVWDTFDEIPFDKLPNEFVLKCTHDCGSVVICKDKATFDFQKSRKFFKKQLAKNYYWKHREWLYKNIKPRILAEKLMVDESGVELKDYKIYCFHGEPKVIGIYFGRFSGEKPKGNFYTPQWEFLNLKTGLKNDPNLIIEKPEWLDKALLLARQLSKGKIHVRVDFYIVENKIYFGELTFYEDAGFIRFEPPEWNQIFGDWMKLPIAD